MQMSFIQLILIVFFIFLSLRTVARRNAPLIVNVIIVPLMPISNWPASTTSLLPWAYWSLCAHLFKFKFTPPHKHKQQQQQNNHHHLHPHSKTDAELFFSIDFFKKKLYNTKRTNESTINQCSETTSNIWSASQILVNCIQRTYLFTHVDFEGQRTK